jgi:hypothetical protein
LATSSTTTFFLPVQGVACRLAGGEDAVFGDELNTLAQQATSSSSSSGVAMRLVARDGLTAEELLQQLQQSMREACKEHAEGNKLCIGVLVSASGGADQIHNSLVIAPLPAAPDIRVDQMPLWCIGTKLGQV